MKAIDHPIVCDSLYNAKGVCPKSISRMALHSKSIEFTDMKGKTQKIGSKLPQEFESLLK
jgi:23S rRNA-/tRNA-specific pseudouridylate synthase